MSMTPRRSGNRKKAPPTKKTTAKRIENPTAKAVGKIQADKVHVAKAQAKRSVKGPLERFVHKTVESVVKAVAEPAKPSKLKEPKPEKPKPEKSKDEEE